LCHHQAKELAKLCQYLSDLKNKSGSESNNIIVPRLVAIGNGSIFFAKKFREGLAFPGEIYIDSASNSFKAMELPRLSVWETVKRFLSDLSLISLFVKLSSTYKNSDTAGDGQQTGAVLLIENFGKENGSIKYEFRECDHPATEFASLQKIYESCGGSGTLSLPDEATEQESSKKSKDDSTTSGESSGQSTDVAKTSSDETKDTKEPTKEIEEESETNVDKDSDSTVDESK